jgi:hypothetical protein
MAVCSLLITISLFGPAAPVHAYGPEQWQIGFSFNCNAPVSFCAGFAFWGWCTFGGSGTTGDCQIETYNFNGKIGPASGPTHLAVDYTGWVIGTGSVLIPAQPTLPAFFASGSGSLTVTGPGAPVLGLSSGVPMTFTCTPAPGATPVPLSAALFFLCDTGIPAVAGHYTYSTIPLFPFLPSQPGIHYDLQVTQISS